MWGVGWSHLSVCLRVIQLAGASAVHLAGLGLISLLQVRQQENSGQTAGKQWSLGVDLDDQLTVLCSNSTPTLAILYSTLLVLYLYSALPVLCSTCTLLQLCSTRTVLD